MKRKKITLFCFLSVILLLVGCLKDNDPIAVSDVTLDKPVIELTVGEAACLTTTVTPEDAADRIVIWSKDNAAIAIAIAIVTATAGDKAAKATSRKSTELLNNT